MLESNEVIAVKNLFMILFLLVLGTWVLSGCGPVRSVNAIWTAEEELQRAKELGADENPNSKYYYVAAEAYLTKAKASMGRSEYEYAGAHYDKNNPFDFAERARELAVEAAKKAKDDSGRVYLGRDPYDPNEEELNVVIRRSKSTPIVQPIEEAPKVEKQSKKVKAPSEKKRSKPTTKKRSKGAKSKKKNRVNNDLFE